MNKLSKDYNLEVLYPDIAKEWHPTKNGELSPSDVFPKTHKKFWWMCKSGHEWEAVMHSRTKGNGCPYCANKKAGYGNDLKTNFSEIAKEWHPTKNGDLKPEHVLPGSHKKIWWKCRKGHEYYTTISHRALRNQGCSYCANKKVGYGNDLETQFPEIAKEWHPTKNGNLLPSKIVYGSVKVVWWMCKSGHEWTTAITNRTHKTMKTNCPKCSNHVSKPALFIYSELKTIFSKIDFEKKLGKFTVDIFVKDLNLIIEYDGAYFHKDNIKGDKIKKIAMIDSGFFLINIRVKPLKKIFKEDISILRKENHSHEFISKILREIIGRNICKDKKLISKINRYLKAGEIQNEKFFYELISSLPGPLPEKSLFDKAPHLQFEWHPTKNGKMSIKDYTFGSHIYTWWLCDKGHEYKARINKKYYGQRCPYCTGHKCSREKSLGVKSPKIAKEWHPTKNGDITPYDILPGSGKKFWWICSKDHIWETTPNLRKKTNCPVCYKNSRKTNK